METKQGDLEKYIILVTFINSTIAISNVIKKLEKLVDRKMFSEDDLESISLELTKGINLLLYYTHMHGNDNNKKLAKAITKAHFATKPEDLFEDTNKLADNLKRHYLDGTPNNCTCDICTKNRNAAKFEKTLFRLI